MVNYDPGLRITLSFIFISSDIIFIYALQKIFHRKIFISDQYNIAYYAIIIIIIIFIIPIVVVYVVDRVLALSFKLDMWILFIHSLFVLPLLRLAEEKCNRNNVTRTTTTQNIVKLLLTWHRFPEELKYQKCTSSFCVINMNESWKMLHTYISKKEVTGNTQPIFAKTSNHSKSSLLYTF